MSQMNNPNSPALPNLNMHSSADDELFDPPREIPDAEIYNFIPRDHVFYFKNTQTSWRMGVIQAEKFRIHEYERFGHTKDVSSVCVATQVEGPSPGTKAVLKIKAQMAPWTGDTSCANYLPITQEIHRELSVLEKLTEGGCSSTPRFIDFLAFEQDDDDPVPDGYFVVFLLEKLPGLNLERTFSEFSLEKRNRVRIAFAKALREFYSFRLFHHDPARRNIIWDERTERCFIVDLEDVEERDHPVFSTRHFDPWRDFKYWELCSGELDTDEANYDPMVPGPHEEIEDTDEALYALAARTKHISKPDGNVATKVK